MKTLDNKTTRLYEMVDRITNRYGLPSETVLELMRLEKVLNTWQTHVCNGTKERDDKNGRVYWANSGERYGRTPDLETGAIKRITAICNEHNLEWYEQSDPRGCCLHIYHAADLEREQVRLMGINPERAARTLKIDCLYTSIATAVYRPN